MNNKHYHKKNSSGSNSDSDSGDDGSSTGVGAGITVGKSPKSSNSTSTMLNVGGINEFKWFRISRNNGPTQYFGMRNIMIQIIYHYIKITKYLF